MGMMQAQQNQKLVAGKAVRTAVFGAVLAAGLMGARPAQAINLCIGCSGTSSVDTIVVRWVVQEELHARAHREAEEGSKPKLKDPKPSKPAAGCSANPRGK